MKEPQAFPTPYNGRDGMTLRDYFAAVAMAHYLLKTSDQATASVHAYAMADAMLEARDATR